jgi:hypothetical protein
LPQSGEPIGLVSADVGLLFGSKCGAVLYADAPLRGQTSQRIVPSNIPHALAGILRHWQTSQRIVLSNYPHSAGQPYVLADLTRYVDASTCPGLPGYMLRDRDGRFHYRPLPKFTWPNPLHAAWFWPRQVGVAVIAMFPLLALVTHSWFTGALTFRFCLYAGLLVGFLEGAYLVWAIWKVAPSWRRLQHVYSHEAHKIETETTLEGDTVDPEEMIQYLEAQHQAEFDSLWDRSAAVSGRRQRFIEELGRRARDEAVEGLLDQTEVDLLAERHQRLIKLNEALPPNPACQLQALFNEAVRPLRVFLDLRRLAAADRRFTGSVADVVEETARRVDALRKRRAELRDAFDEFNRRFCSAEPSEIDTAEATWPTHDPEG